MVNALHGQSGEVLVAIVVNQVHQDHNQEGQAVLAHLLSPVVLFGYLQPLFYKII